MELVSCHIINCPPLTTFFHPTTNLTVINFKQTIPQCNLKFHSKPQQLDSVSTHCTESCTFKNLFLLLSVCEHICQLPKPVS